MAGAVVLAGVGISIGTVKTLEARFHRPNLPAVAHILDDRAEPDDRVMYYGRTLWPYILNDGFPPYYKRDHSISIATTPETIRRGFEPRVGRRIFLVEVQPNTATRLPAVAGWALVERRSFEGNPPLLFGLYQQRRPATSLP
jgi:hypothetical protein